MVGTGYAGYRGSEAPKCDGRIARDVEVLAGEEQSRRVPAVSRGGVPMPWAGLAQGSPSNGGGSSSITSLKEPIRLWKPSNMLELTGRVVSNGHAYKSCRPLETLPDHLGLTP